MVEKIVAGSEETKHKIITRVVAILGLEPYADTDRALADIRDSCKKSPEFY